MIMRLFLRCASTTLECFAFHEPPLSRSLIECGSINLIIVTKEGQRHA